MGLGSYFRIVDTKTGLFMDSDAPWAGLDWWTKHGHIFRSMTAVKKLLRAWRRILGEIPETWIVVESRIYEGRRTPARHVLKPPKPPPPEPCARCAIKRDYFCSWCKLHACKVCARFHKCPKKVQSALTPGKM